MEASEEYEATAVYPVTLDIPVRHCYPVLRDSGGAEFLVDSAWAPRKIWEGVDAKRDFNKGKPLVLFEKSVEMPDISSFFFQYASRELQDVLQQELSTPISFETAVHEEHQRLTTDHGVLDVGLYVTKREELADQLIDLGARLIGKADQVLVGEHFADHASRLLYFGFHCVNCAERPYDDGAFDSKKGQSVSQHVLLEEVIRRIRRQDSIFQSHPPEEVQTLSDHLAESTYGQITDFLEFEQSVQERLGAVQ